jgi:preprotein translocase subunit SecE
VHKYLGVVVLYWERGELQKEIFVAAKEEKSTTTMERRQPNALQRYMNETVGELRKVNWPSRTEALNLTLVVLIVMFSMALILGVLDFAYAQFFALLLG